MNTWAIAGAPIPAGELPDRASLVPAVGSTNLNLTSWIGNWELDVAVQDERFAAATEEMYMQDLSQSTEVVLTARRDVRLREHPEPRPQDHAVDNH